MPFRSLAALVAVIVVAACAESPPETGSLPDVEDVLDPPAQCTFLVGDPQGVSVEEVLGGSAADGSLEPGDVLIAVDGNETPSADALIEAMAGSSPGDTVEIEYLRDGEAATTELTLGADPDDPDRAMIGVMIQTSYETLDPSAATGPVRRGGPTRPISIGGRVYLLDPIGIEWEQTETEVEPDLPWIATSEGIYAMEDGTLTDVLADEQLDPGPFQGWDPVRAMGSVGADLILVATQPVSGDPTRATVGIARYDPVDLEGVWVEPVIDGFGIPVSALGSPGQDRMIVVGVDEAGTEITSIQVWDTDGFDTGLGDLTALGTPVGWLDEETALFRTDADTATALSVVTGESEELTLTERIAGLPLFPVGDGRSVLSVEGRTLVLDDLTTDEEIRVLARDCTIDRVGEPGWQG